MRQPLPRDGLFSARQPLICGGHASASPLSMTSAAATPVSPRHPVGMPPARLATTRLPNKPLPDIHGLPMIVHVCRRAMGAGVGPVVVACAAEAHAAAVTAAGRVSVMTD